MNPFDHLPDDVIHEILDALLDSSIRYFYWFISTNKRLYSIYKSRERIYLHRITKHRFVEVKLYLALSAISDELKSASSALGGAAPAALLPILDELADENDSSKEPAVPSFDRLQSIINTHRQLLHVHSWIKFYRSSKFSIPANISHLLALKTLSLTPDYQRTDVLFHGRTTATQTYLHILDFMEAHFPFGPDAGHTLDSHLFESIARGNGPAALRLPGGGNQVWRHYKRQLFRTYRAPITHSSSAREGFYLRLVGVVRDRIHALRGDYGLSVENVDEAAERWICESSVEEMVRAWGDVAFLDVLVQYGLKVRLGGSMRDIIWSGSTWFIRKAAK